MTKANKTEIVVILDASSSMNSCREGTITGFNKFLSEQKQVEGECNLSLIQFAGRGNYKVKIASQDVRSVFPITYGDYIPNGNTALYDAVGRAIDDTGARLRNTPEWERPSNVVFFIVTDGEENDSVIHGNRFNSSIIREKIEHQRAKYNWNFMYLGANHDAFAASKSLGICEEMTSGYISNNVGAANVFALNSRKFANYRSSNGDKSVLNYSADERHTLETTK
jgi:hypothetical protein